MRNSLPGKIFNSQNTFFNQDINILSEKRHILRRYLEDVKEYNASQVKIYLKAYDYFVDNPLAFDGATMTEDLYDINGLELSAMLHDYLYIEYNCSGNFKYRLMVDQLFRHEMIRMHKSSWNIGVRFILLFFIAFVPHTIYSYLFLKRRMSYAQKVDVDGFLITLRFRTPRKWYKEFKGELTWISIFIVVLLLWLIFILN